jgi:DNA-binding transcriptional LysR family regulator
MDTLKSMQVFRAVAELKSFASAARKLDMSGAMATKHVMHLERRLNTRLLNRTSRHVSLTESGTVYLEQTRRMLDDLHDVENSVSRMAVIAHGSLKLSAPAWMASPHFVSALAEYHEMYPDVQVDLDLSGRMVNLVDEGFDLALRLSRNLNDNLIAKQLAKVKFFLVASPMYLKNTSPPSNAFDLSNHAWLQYAMMPTENIMLSGPNGDESIKLPPAKLVCNNESLLHEAALHGMGIALLPNWLVEDDIKMGRLMRVLPSYLPFEMQIYGVYANRKYLSSKVRTFLDFMAENL